MEECWNISYAEKHKISLENRDNPLQNEPKTQVINITTTLG